jgi:hypothetical protein
LKCGSLRKKKSRRESAKRTDRSSRLFLVSWASQLSTSSREEIAPKTTIKVATNATQITKITTTREVATVATPEAAEVATEITPREIKAKMPNSNSFFSFFLSP